MTEYASIVMLQCCSSPEDHRDNNDRMGVHADGSVLQFA